MAERDLVLRLRAELGDTQAQLAALKQQVADLAAAQAGVAPGATAAASALTEQGAAAEVAATGLTAVTAATEDAALATTASGRAFDAEYRAELAVGEATTAVNAALSAAMTSMGEWASAAVTGSAAAAESFIVARDAVAALEVEIERARALGAPVSPVAISTLAAYDSALASSAASTEALAAASKGAATQTGYFGSAGRQAGLEMRLLRSELGPAGLALGVLGQGMSGFLLPAALAGAGVIAVNAALKQFEDRGVGTKSAGTLISDVFDAIAIAVGGTSKGVAEMEAILEKAQSKLDDLAVTSRSYKDAEDLLTASGVNAEAVFKAQAEALPNLAQQVDRTGVRVADLKDRIAAATKEADDFNKKINDIRLIDPEGASELARRFVELNAALAAGKITAAEYAAAQSQMNAETAKLTPAVEAVASAINDKFGPGAKAARAEIENLVVSTDNIGKRLAALQAGGLTAGQAMDVLKSEIQKTGTASELYIGIIDKLPPKLKEQFTALMEYARAHGLVADAIEKAREKTQASVNTFDAIVAAIDHGTRAYGSQEQAIRAVLPAIDSLTASIEKRRDSQGKLEVSDQAMLDELEKWRAKTGEVTSETEKLIKAEDKHAEKLAALEVSLEKNTEAYSKNLAKIEEHSQKAIDAIEKERVKLEADYGLELAALNRRFQQGEIAQTDYNTAINNLVAQEAQAKRTAYEEEKRIDDEAQVAKADATERFREAETKIVTAINDEKASLADLKTAREAVAAGAKSQVDAFEGIGRAASTSAGDVGKHKDAQIATDKAVRETTKGLEDHGRTHTKLHDLIPKTTKHVAELNTAMEDTAGVAIVGIAAAVDTSLIPSIDRAIAKLAELDAASSKAFSGITSGGGSQLG